MPFSALVILAWIAKEKDRTLAGVLTSGWILIATRDMMSDCECRNGFHFIFSRSGFPLNPVIWLAVERSGFSLYGPINRTANSFPQLLLYLNMDCFKSRVCKIELRVEIK